MRRVLSCSLLVLLNGCGLDYYLHLARGQARIAWRSRPIHEVLSTPTTPPATAERLRLVGELRDFASEELGLQPGDSYTLFFDTGGEPVSWNVSASPPDRFAPHLWYFPVVGELPYKGFFSRERATHERDLLLAQGLDVVMSPVSAYSTLGYFSDPVLSTMLDEEEGELAELLLHELTHGTIFPAGQAEYSESAATFVGQAGALLYLERKYGPQSAQLRRAELRQADVHLFSTFVREVADSLEDLYDRQLPRDTVLKERELLFARAKDHYRARRGGFAVSNFDGFLRWEVNNARLLGYRRYHRDLDLFARVWATYQGTPIQAVVEFRDCGEAPDPWRCLRLLR